MTVITTSLAFASLTALGLGIAVFCNNYKRKANQAFLVASACMFFWLLSNIFIIHTHTPNLARVGISIAFAIAACIPTTFHLLRLGIKSPESNWSHLLKKCRTPLFANILVSLSCFLPNFIKSVSFPLLNDGTSLATPEYGWPYGVFNAYFIWAIAFFAYSLFKDRRILTGSQRIELEFLGFACIAGLVVGLTCGTVFAFLTQTSAPVPAAHALSVLTLSAIVAYGISVHKILAVAVILRTVTTYSLLLCYLITIYIASWFALTFIAQSLHLQSTLPIHIACTLIVVFSMSPVRNKIQQAADKLITFESTNIPVVIKEAGSIFQSVTTYQALLSQFANLLSASFSAEHVSIQIVDGTGFREVFVTHQTRSSKQLALEDPLPLLVDKKREPISQDSLIRLRPNEMLKRASQQLTDLGAQVAVGVFSKSALTALIFLGPRATGRIYDKTEQDALQMLCNQFAVALENARLYTEAQDSKIRNEIMLEQLASGVVMANPDREITLLNKEAQRVTGLTEKAVGQKIDILPKPITLALTSTLETQTGMRNVDATLFEEGEERSPSIRIGSAYLLGHDGNPMGALLVFTDTTELKSLEEQVRRSDQLSSVGTLAAGMAHEIKNPLVTIKTFTQLLPQRHEDEDFRREFASLVGHEVGRIDGIVNQLLSFSKPTTPHLEPMRFHETIEKTTKLVHEQLSQKNIELENNFRATRDNILGDPSLLTQALVNLHLNAIDAIGENGKITVGTINCSYRFANGDDPQKATSKKCIRLQIKDTGKGIPHDKLQKIFDPFFTSKSEGTGMGLSVAHGVIQEHDGIIEVESQLGKGTTFYIYIPITKEEEPAA